MKYVLVPLFFASSAMVANAVCPSWPTAERFIINGPEITDQRTGLVWARCSVGQSWNGTTCIGSASTFAHEAAMAHAQTQTGWRMPSVKELSTLADKGCANPAIDSTAFPATPSNWYWSSSPYVGSASYAWLVNFNFGNVNGFGGRNGEGVPIRLLRVDQ